MSALGLSNPAAERSGGSGGVPSAGASQAVPLPAGPVEVTVATASAGRDAALPASPAGEPRAVIIDPASAQPSPEFLALIEHDYARRHLVLSAGTTGQGRTERLLIAESTRPTIPFNIGVRLGRGVATQLASSEAIAAAIDRAYTQSNPSGAAPSETPVIAVEGVTGEDVAGELEAAVREAEKDLLHTQGKAPVVRLVDLVLFEALLRSASDVHIQPVRDGTLVRYRLDGALHTVRVLPGSLASAVVSRIKVMARLDVAEHRAPQDGRASVTIGAGSGAASSSQGRRIDLRISTLPSTYGERVVIRLLDPSRSPHLSSFAALGMPQAIEKQYLEQVSRTSGIVLSTGPTGSGKTTTLYATLAWTSQTNGGMDRPHGSADPTEVPGVGRGGCELNIMTVEDPVEYDLSSPGIAVSQTQVDPKKQVTFATGLRHILRQDPDVIMVGEIRDEETARIAVQASLTGHLVLSTLHTNDAPSAVARLIDLGVEPFLVSSSLSAVLAQRLVRTVHRVCSGKGCQECLLTGYKGRTGVFELLVLESTLRALVERRCSAVELKARAQELGMVTLKEAASKLVQAGVTTAIEVGRVVEALDEEDEELVA